MNLELVRDFDLTLLQRLVQLETEAFGIGGLNEWHLVPFIRHGRVFITRQNQEVVGSIQYMLDWENHRKAYLMGVSIDKRLRGQELGTKFMKKSLQILAGENIEEVELTVDPRNAAAIRVYENKLGFTTVDARNNEYGQGENRLVMTISLKGFLGKNI
ncbi:GNAT family N-acetyltransferase [Sporomusa acidovorans]|uniref:N-acetyltransferase domain-containing protein n=1 Tax=Sporomusa acidovorans (strain ATCC 49682 / DSM 3132 / Mol) TaxID=1123286 RepID=A0ABZ3J384_SPOA4|nr:GNAT family N-acetyltransferase [Sporomusa acidovorans]OZC21992.1 mycothiol acetyltransferase [Sporomusa acidovorans DSM 3132]SDF80187.1 ribosomal-protein-alanine N-acetyltransferase [Sporomusa acidovorans]